MGGLSIYGESSRSSLTWGICGVFQDMGGLPIHGESPPSPAEFRATNTICSKRATMDMKVYGEASPWTEGSMGRLRNPQIYMRSFNPKTYHMNTPTLGFVLHIAELTILFLNCNVQVQEKMQYNLK